MRVAFVGIRKDWRTLEERAYVGSFVQYHLELPWYFATHRNEVDVVSEDVPDGTSYRVKENVEVISEAAYERRSYDVVVHWRKWFERLYKSDAQNVINSQDHSYGEKWLLDVFRATAEGKLHEVLCFPTWHERQLHDELSVLPVRPALTSGLTLGVDTEIYHPEEKDPFMLLWASDPGRGLHGALSLHHDLYRVDQRFTLHVCWPDYAQFSIPKHGSGVVVHENLQNGPELWNLFNYAGFLPYTSTFKEPSSRAHRQAQAAGCVVLYPHNMGSPSHLITSGIDGYVQDLLEWDRLMLDIVADPNFRAFEEISKGARALAVRENWEVQAKRFNQHFESRR